MFRLCSVSLTFKHLILTCFSFPLYLDFKLSAFYCFYLTMWFLSFRSIFKISPALTFLNYSLKGNVAFLSFRKAGNLSLVWASFPQKAEEPCVKANCSRFSWKPLCLHSTWVEMIFTNLEETLSFHSQCAS